MNIPVRDYLQLLYKYLRPQWLEASLLALLLSASILLQLANPQIMRRFIDTVQAGGSLDGLMRVALLYLGVALLQQAVSVLSTYLSESVGWTATNDLRADLADHCLRLDLSFHNAHTPGEMIERIDGDVTALSNFFSRFTVQVLGSAVLMAGILALLFREDWRVGLPVTLFAAAALYVLIRFRDITVPYWTAERQASAELFGFLEERLAGTEDIRANGARPYVMRKFHRLMRELLRRSLRASLRMNVLFNVMFLLFAIGNATAFAIGAGLFQAQAISIGTVYIIFQYTTMLQRPIEDISRQLQDLQRAGAGIRRVQGLLNVRSRIREEAGQDGLKDGHPAGSPAAPLEVVFRDVAFGYHDGPRADAPGAPASEMVLHGLSFRLAPGQVLGLLGRTGSGKTSLTRLLFRLYDPDRGAILMAPASAGGGPSRPVDIRRLPLAQLRRQVGMITQNIQLFNASVRDNLTFFDASISDERILLALQDLGLWSWFESLPQGLDTELESGGSGLSAGQAQLLAFARIFLRDPGLVILDEASSRLDPATEALIERAVERLVRGRTAIIVAHHLGTVQRVDQIMVLDGGRIVEHGEREALYADPASHFSGLLRTGLEDLLA